MHPSNELERSPPLTHQALSMDKLSSRSHQTLSIGRAPGWAFRTLDVQPPLVMIHDSKGLMLAPQKLELRLGM